MTDKIQNNTPITDGMAFDVNHSAYGGKRHSKYGLLVYADAARELETQLNAANERIQELEAYIALAKSGIQQLLEYWESKQTND